MRSLKSLPLVVLLLAGCGTDPMHTGSDPLLDQVGPVRVAIGDTLRLRPGQVAEAGAEPLRILFVGVTNDSRCPRNVTPGVSVDCVWEGDATAAIRLSLSGEAAADATLHTNEGAAGGPREVLYGGYLVTLLDVEPYPVYQETIAAGDYRVLLRVTRP